MGWGRSLASVGGLMIVVGAALLAVPAGAADPEVLASLCSGCHTNDDRLTTTIPRIRGLAEGVIVQAMQAFRTGQRPATVMDRIAKGFTEDEIKQLATVLGARK